jgi:CRISPR-associated endonuclease/helicase Cas3
MSQGPSFEDGFDAQFQLRPVWLPGEPESDYFPIDAESIHGHQLEMQRVMQRGEPEVVVNSNPTGAGKTLSWVAPTIRSGERGDGWIVVATYPTNTLVSDQAAAIREYLERYYTSEYATDLNIEAVQTPSGIDLTTEGDTFALEERVKTVSGATTRGEATSDALEAAFDEAQAASVCGLPTILLTTPDTVTLLAANRFESRDLAAFLNHADRIVIDEFHLSNPRGERLLPFHLDIIMRLSDRRFLKQLVFLSATPKADYLHRLERIFDVHHVTTARDDGNINGGGYEILPPATLYVTSRRMFQNGQWLAEQADRLLKWHADSEGQLLVILDSVREVKTAAIALEDASDGRTVGRIYGWKTQGRQTVVDDADIIVANTAAEVGVDFPNVTRLVCSAYDPASAIQRLGRMRARDAADDYELALITSPETHNELCEAASDGALSRGKVDAVADRTLDTVSVAPYYELLCGGYAQFLYEEVTDRPLQELATPEAQAHYRSAVFDHFGGTLDQIGEGSIRNADAFWDFLTQIVKLYDRDRTFPLFEEMHTFRPSSLSVVVLDTTDSEEPVLTYDLGYLLRYGRGRFVQGRDELRSEYESVFGRPLRDDEKDLLNAASRFVCGYFVFTGTRETPRQYGLTQYGRVASWRKQWSRARHSCQPEVLHEPRISLSEPDLAVPKDAIDLEDRVLAQYIGCPTREARLRYRLGPYASVLPLGDNDSLALWQDAILVHATLMSDAPMIQ